MNNSSRIPRIIHYCWFGKRALPPLAVKCIETWAARMPGCEIRRWDETNVDLGVPFLADAYAKGSFAFVSDYVRLDVLRKHGGVYLDTDIELVRALDPLLQSNSCFLGEEMDGRPNTAVLGAEPDHPFLVEALRFMEKRFANKLPYLIAPEVAQAVLQNSSLQGHVDIFPPRYFYPYNPFDSGQLVKTLMYVDIAPDTYAIHHWAKAWKLDFRTRVRRAVDKLRASLDSSAMNRKLL